MKETNLSGFPPNHFSLPMVNMNTEYFEDFLCHREGRYGFGGWQRALVRGWSQVLASLLTHCLLLGKRKNCSAPLLPVHG